MSAQDHVEEFHRVFGVAISQPATAKLLALRASLIDEEAGETIYALQRNDMPGIADGLADLVYVAYGTATSLGIDLDAAVAEVHRSNMSKLGADGKPIYRADGKVLKGPRYQPPDMTVALPAPRG